MMWGYGGHWSSWQVILSWIGMIAFWAVLLWLVYFVVTRAIGRSDSATLQESARQILDARLARGEIDTDEYHRLRNAMTTSSEQIVKT
jgi:putative membrane protein